MSDIKDMIVDVTNNIFKDHTSKELIDKSENGEWSQGLWDVLSESELISIGIPEGQGGSGGDFEDAFSIINLAGKYAVPLPLSETIIVKKTLAELGQKTNSDPVTSSIELGNTVQFVKTDEGFLITGTLTNVPWGRHVKSVLALGELEGKTVVGLLPIDKADVQLTNNIAGEPRDTLVFENVQVKDLQLHPVDRDAFIEKMVNLFTLSRITMMAGAIETILELTVRYTKEREQFGRPLHRFQMVQQHLATLAGETVITISSMNNVIEVYKEGQFVRELAYARIRVNEAARIVAKSAHQTHAGIGVTYEHRLHQYTRRLWAWREEYGNETVWLEKVATYLLESPEEGLWETMTK
ncbi:acyl-CoA dehydrogenase family protein [Sporosarcina sp. CAU 1771]